VFGKRGSGGDGHGLQPALICFEAGGGKGAVHKVVIAREGKNVIIHPYAHPAVGAQPGEIVPYLPPLLPEGPGPAVVRHSVGTVPGGVLQGVHLMVGVVIAYRESVGGGVRQQIQLFAETVQTESVSGPPEERDVTVSVGRIQESAADVHGPFRGGIAAESLGRGVVILTAGY